MSSTVTFAVAVDIFPLTSFTVKVTSLDEPVPFKLMLDLIQSASVILTNTPFANVDDLSVTVTPLPSFNGQKPTKVLSPVSGQSVNNS